MEEVPEVKIGSARGALSEYANPRLLKEEGSAWEKAVMGKYGNA